jgi:diguanylate cyclase (GGDEF)-like protein/PAS domain S-box-containing protein
VGTKVIGEKVFQRWTIKGLLQLWSLATLLAIVVISGVALYVNSFFFDAQQQLTKQVLPLESTSRQLTVSASLFIARQEQLVASQSLDELNSLTSRQQLEQQFDECWQKLKSLVSFEQGEVTAVDAFYENYQQFLQVDNTLFDLVEQQHQLEVLVHQQLFIVRSLEQKIQNQVETLSEKIELNVTTDESSTEQIETITTLEKDELAKLNQNIRLDVLNVFRLTQKLMQSNTVNSLMTENDVRHDKSSLINTVKRLQKLLRNDQELLLLAQGLSEQIQTLMQLVIDDKQSVFKIRNKQVQTAIQLNLEQQKSLSTLTLMMASLNDLSDLVSIQSMAIVSKASKVSENSNWALIILSLCIAVGMLWFVSSISARINAPLAELRKAMSALSLEKFDTRLNVISGKSEFSLLARDFNSFAGDTQQLIDDLADANDSLEVREQYITAILNGVPEAILTLTPLGIIESTNPRADRILSAEKHSLIGLNITQIFAEGQDIEYLADVVNKQSFGQEHEFEGIALDGKAFSMGISLSLVSSLDKDFWVCVISDITALKQAEENLRTTSSELDTILENAMVGIAFIKDKTILRVNHKFEELFSCLREEIAGQSTRVLYPSDEACDRLREQAYGVLEQGDNFEGQVELVRQNGETFWCALSMKAIDPNQPQEGTIWLFEDVTAQRESEQRLRKLASFDSLTGLPNRTLFNDRLEHALHKTHRTSGTLAVFFLDLDHFKNINDSLGHKAGDLLLCEVATRLKLCIREGDTVARLGGDEFTIILEEVKSAKFVAKVATKILDAISQSYMLDSTEVNISPSIGVSLYPSDGRDVDILLRNADAAMYHAKKHGRNNFQFYSTEMNAQADKRLAMETSLRRAVENDEFFLNYQPQIDVVTGKVVAAEALLRWHSEQWGNVSPAQFIPILEDTGLIATVGEQILRQACEAYMSIRKTVPSDFLIAVNLSGRQFKGGQLTSYIQNLLDELGMSAANLELEITESILMSDIDLAVRSLRELSELGITLAVDDFGTGYSSLSYLKQFSLNVLKIDRSFVNDVTEDADDAAIVDAIIAMSKRLQLDVVAEGVETAAQLSFLQEQGCQRVQGFYFSKPLSLDDLIAYIENTEIAD